MSRIGKKVILIPEKTEVTASGSLLKVKGPLGELSRQFPATVSFQVEAGKVSVLPKDASEDNVIWGTWASHLSNMISGVNKVFQKKLIIEGIGYKADLKGEELVMALGFSHPVKVKVPKGIKVVTEKGLITMSSIDKESLGQFAAQIRDYKKPEPYKGKGIRYDTEVIRRKQGKKSV